MTPRTTAAAAAAADAVTDVDGFAPYRPPGRPPAHLAAPMPAPASLSEADTDPEWPVPARRSRGPARITVTVDDDGATNIHIAPRGPR